MITHARNQSDRSGEKAMQHSLDAAAGDADEGPEAGAHVLRPLDQRVTSPHTPRKHRDVHE
jgi:hypothetical protein